jgi:hypothetical protein
MLSKVDIICDVCKNIIHSVDINSGDKDKVTSLLKKEKYPVIKVKDFISGNNIEKKLDTEYLHVCKNCEQIMLDGNLLFSESVMYKTNVSFKKKGVINENY